jgi:hypothetical protein
MPIPEGTTDSAPALTVVFLDLTGAKSVRARISPTVTVKRILPAIITKMNLPLLAPDGTPMAYSIDSKRLGMRLKEHRTLLDQAVREGDSLVVCPEMIAG